MGVKAAWSPPPNLSHPDTRSTSKLAGGDAARAPQRLLRLAVVVRQTVVLAALGALGVSKVAAQEAPPPSWTPMAHRSKSLLVVVAAVVAQAALAPEPPAAREAVRVRPQLPMAQQASQAAVRAAVQVQTVALPLQARLAPARLPPTWVEAEAEEPDTQGGRAAKQAQAAPRVGEAAEAEAAK